MADDIKLVVGVDYTELTGLIRTTSETKTAVKALAQDFAKTGSQSQYMRGINQIVSAQKNLKSSSRMSQSDIMKLGAETRRQVKFKEALANATKKAALAEKDFTASQMAATKTSKNLGVVTQQAGYQVSDFIVQVQSGTNPFVAFGQQASQLVGVLPLLSTQLGISAGTLIGISSALGIVIPLVTAVGAAFLNSSKASKDASKNSVSYADALSDVTNSAKRASTELYALQNGIEDNTIAMGRQGIEAQKLVIRQNDLYNQSNKLKSFFYEAGGGFSVLGFQIVETDEKKLELLQEQLKVYEEQSKKVKEINDRKEKQAEIIEKIKTAEKDFSDREKEDFKTAGNLLNAQKDELEILKLKKDAKSSEKDIQEAINKVALKQYEDQIAYLMVTQPKMYKSLVKNFKEMQKITGEIEKQNELTASNILYDNRLDSLAKINNLLELELKHGKDSLEYKSYEAGIADEKLKKEIDLLEISDEQKDILKGLIDDQRGLLAQLDKEEKKRKRILKLTEEAASAYSKSKVVGIKADVFDPRGEAGITAVEAMRAGVQVFDYGKGDGTKLPKGKTPAESMASIIKGMEEEANLQRKLVGLSDQEADRLQILYDLKEQNKDASGKMTEAQLKQAAERIAAINAETAAMEAQMQKIQDVADSFETHFGDALMGIVTDFDFLNDSIEDFGYNAEQVFKNMAREIIKELYRIFVVKKITGFISGAIGDVGSLYQGSTGFMQFSGGGYTGSGPRSGGLDGKGGFLAMLHPRETVIDHTKGQSAEGVTVVQNINISTGVQQTVRNEIRTLMPQIANSAKAAVSDAKRRGGSYGRALS